MTQTQILKHDTDLQNYSQSHWPHSSWPFHHLTGTIPSFHCSNCEAINGGTASGGGSNWQLFWEWPVTKEPVALWIALLDSLNSNTLLSIITTTAAKTKLSQYGWTDAALNIDLVTVPHTKNENLARLTLDLSWSRAGPCTRLDPKSRPQGYVQYRMKYAFPVALGWKRGPNPWPRGREFYDIEGPIECTRHIILERYRRNKAGTSDQSSSGASALKHEKVLWCWDSRVRIEYKYIIIIKRIYYTY